MDIIAKIKWLIAVCVIFSELNTSFIIDDLFTIV